MTQLTPNLLPQNRRAGGFTLLEVMVVLAIIGGLLALVSFSGDTRQSEDQTTRFGQQINALFIAYRQEAVFQNLDLGVAVDDEGLYLFNFQDINSQEFAANKTREELDQLVKNPWQPYSGSLKNMLEMAEEITLDLHIEGREIDLSPSALSSEEIKPVLFFLSADEYTPFAIKLSHQADDSFVVHVKGDGFNAPWVEVERYED